jgi:glycosyltransferase involved in cell wall biosynthesis
MRAVRRCRVGRTCASGDLDTGIMRRDLEELMPELIDRATELATKSTNASCELAGRRILVVMPTIPLYGMERKTLSIMKHLRERGADVLFITQKDYGQRIQQEVDRIGCRWVPGSFDKLLHLPRGPIEGISLVRSWIRSACELNGIRKLYRPTHIHIPNVTLFLYAWPVLLRASETVVFALPTPPDTSFTGLRRQLNNFIWRWGVERVCDHIVCNSVFTLSQLRAIGMNMRKASLIYNSAPERTLTVGDAPVLNPAKLNVAYVGQICPEKGLKEFIDAASRIALERDDAEFYLAGDYKWRNPFARDLIDQIRAKGLADRIHFLGEINDVPELLSQCDLHVCPSVWEEPFGLVVLEAKRQGIPSVVFPSGALKETVTHLVDGYVCGEKTWFALYEGLRYFLDRPERMSQAGHAATCSLTHFSQEKAAADWASLFLETGTPRGSCIEAQFDSSSQLDTVCDRYQ